MPSHFVGGNSLISHTVLINWGGGGRLLKVTQCQEGGRLLFLSMWEVKASWW